MATQKYILTEAYNGLFALDIETGATLWEFTGTYGSAEIRDGRTPCVDQSNNWIYYQTLGRLFKLNALNGQVLDYVAVTDETQNTSGNTMLVNDGHGYFIVTFFWKFSAYGGAIKVYDQNLDLVWEADGLNSFVKSNIVYNDGVVYFGTGDSFQYEYNHEWYSGQKEDCKVIAYDVTDGSVNWTWEADASADYVPNKNKAVLDLIYCNGYLIALSALGGGVDNTFGMVWVINASDGSLLKTYTHDKTLTSCGRAAFSYGRLIKGNLTNNEAEVIQIGVGAKADYAPFGNHKLNHCVADSTALTGLDETITYVGSVSGTAPIEPAQGSIVYNGKVYTTGHGTAGGVVSFDIETLTVSEEYDTGAIWDSSPMIVANINDDPVLLIYRSDAPAVGAFDLSTGNLIWESSTALTGYLFFGFTYYEAAYTTLLDGFDSPAIIESINSNLATLNSLIADAATISTIDSLVGWVDAVNTNIANLNTEGVEVTVEEITVGMTGQQVINIINNFVIDYAEAN